MRISTPREPITIESNSTFRASFEYSINNPERTGIPEPPPDSAGKLDGSYSDEIPVDDFDDLASQSQFSFSTIVASRFMNPTSELPVKASEFLASLDLSAAMPVLYEKYADNTWHFRRDPQAMLKAQIFRRLMGLRWHTDLERYLQGHPEEAKTLGLNGTSLRNEIPNHCTFSHFERRLALDGMREIFEILVMQVRSELDRRRMTLGANVAIDSTPIAGKANDPDANFNAHYRKKGYKIHSVYDLDFQLPIAVEFTKINDGDAPHLPRLLDKLHSLGMDPKGIFADGAYASYDNLTFIGTNCKGKAHFNFRSNAKENKMGTVDAITRLHRSQWKSEGYDSKAPIDNMLQFLLDKGYKQEVGAYYWNQYVKDWQDHRESTKAKYNRRAAIEAFHGHLKQQMLLEKFMDARGLERAERHILMTYITILAVALCRLQHGITDGLSNVKCFN